MWEPYVIQNDLLIASLVYVSVLLNGCENDVMFTVGLLLWRPLGFQTASGSSY